MKIDHNYLQRQDLIFNANVILMNLLTLRNVNNLLPFLNKQIYFFFCFIIIKFLIILYMYYHLQISLINSKFYVIISFVNIQSIPELSNKPQFYLMKKNSYNISNLFLIFYQMHHFLSEYLKTIKYYHKNNTCMNINR